MSSAPTIKLRVCYELLRVPGFALRLMLGALPLWGTAWVLGAQPVVTGGAGVLAAVLFAYWRVWRGTYVRVDAHGLTVSIDRKVINVIDRAAVDRVEPGRCEFPLADQPGAPSRATEHPEVVTDDADDDWAVSVVLGDGERVPLLALTCGDDLELAHRLCHELTAALKYTDPSYQPDPVA